MRIYIDFILVQGAVVESDLISSADKLRRIMSVTLLFVVINIIQCVAAGATIFSWHRMRACM